MVGEKMEKVESMEKNLHQRMSAIMAEAGVMPKNGTNTFNNYSYVKESDVAEKMQGLLVKHGVFIYSSVKDVKTIQTQSSQGKPSLLSTVVMEYRIQNVDDKDDFITVNATGDGMDTGDKAVYKALTGAHKYMFIRNFNLGSDEDAEKESPEVAAHKPSTADNFIADTVDNNMGF